MTRDYSQFLPPTAQHSAPIKPTLLQHLGWSGFFAHQISADEMSETPPVRVTEVHRSGFRALGDDIDTTLPPSADITVGDWLLLNRDAPAQSRLLDRKSVVKRLAPGTERRVQLVAANLDTAFIVTSCNHDFNIARLERYIALVLETDVSPVIVLTKPDLCDDETLESYVQQAGAISPDVPVVVLNALGGDVPDMLAPWLRVGQTLAFLGSSGVGKSTLVNALAGVQAEQTQAIREDDSKGRHTTTRRHLHALPFGGTVLDTPGMRELQMAEAQSGIADLFGDLEELSQQCRFRDCRHESEPGCAVQAAIDAGETDADRVARWQKLAREEAFNSSTLGERKAKNRALSRLVRQVMKDKPR